MSTPDRIDELRKKFDENPRRYFAPLANEYRKAGDLAQAIALCREHLPKQPGHMSGHIVYGQALYEAAELTQARTVFESALALDPENLIALRHLGDIAKASGDASTARRWYERVLDADPRNDDIAAQLATLGSGTPAAPMPAVAPGPVVGRSAPSVDVPSYTGSNLTPPFGIGALPTPDAAMRAVDFDVVNAQIARYTPLDLYAIESSTDRTPADSPADPPAAAQQAAPAERADTADSLTVSDTREPVAAPRAFEPLDLDAMDAAHVEPVAEAESRSESHADVEFASEPLAEAELHAEPHAGEDTSSEPQLEISSVMDDAFASAASADSPDAVDVADAANADDYIAPVSEDTPVSSDAADHTAVEFEEGIFAPEWPADTAAIIASIATPRHATPIMSAPAIAEPSEAAALAFGREADDAAPDADAIDDASDDVEVVATDSGDDMISGGDDVPASEEESAPAHMPEHMPEHMHEQQHQHTDDAAPVLESVRDIAAEAAPDGEARGDVAESETAVPPLAWDDTPNEFTQELSPESFADAPVDASHAATDEPLDDASVDASNEPLDDASDEPLDDAPVEPLAVAPESMPAFATETMGELLVSQGFIQRAADVYEELVRRRPYDPVLTSRLAELRERLVADGQADDTTSRRSTPQRSTPQRSTPQRSTPLRSTPLRSTPLRSTPLRVTPLRATPLRGVAPVDQFSRADEGEQVTAHELFARIAARRVPRRTPPQAMPAVAPDAAEGLSSLFAGSETAHDDVAARALADAFAPISAEDMASGSTLDLDFGNPSQTPSHTPAHTPTTAFSHASGLLSPASVQSNTPAAANAGFSFDRFFPDPARAATGTPPAPVPSQPSASSPSPASGGADVPAAPAKATEDLAQFSAWLKGLGGS